MAFKNAQSYLDSLGETEFNQTFSELAHTSAFSRIVSGAQQPTDYEKVRNQLQDSAVPTEFYATGPATDSLVRLVAARIMRAMGR